MINFKEGQTAETFYPSFLFMRFDIFLGGISFADTCNICRDFLK